MRQRARIAIEEKVYERNFRFGSSRITLASATVYGANQCRATGSIPHVSGGIFPITCISVYQACINQFFLHVYQACINDSTTTPEKRLYQRIDTASRKAFFPRACISHVSVMYQSCIRNADTHYDT